MSGKIRRIICAALCAALCAGPGTALPAAAEENGEGILKGIQTEQVSGDGFTIAYPAGEEQHRDEAGGLLIRSECRDGENTYVFEGKLFLTDKVIPGGFAEDPEKAREFFENHLQNAGDPDVTDYHQEILEADGHPALAERYEYRGEGGSLWSIGRLWYPRNNRILRISIVSAPEEDNGGEEDALVVSVLPAEEVSSEELAELYGEPSDSSQESEEQPRKKKKWKRILIAVVSILLAIIIALVVTFFVMREVGRRISIRTRSSR